MSTSRAYLAKRLKAIGRDDLLAAAERGEVSLHAAALWAGLITQQSVPEGNGSPNVSKRAAWALMKAERQASPLVSKPTPQPAPEIRPTPSVPKFSQDSRAIIEKLVAAGRADLVIAVTERKISPFAAARIADRGGSRRSEKVDRPDVTKTVTKTLPRAVELETDQKAEPAKPEAKRLKPEAKRPDVRALIG